MVVAATKHGVPFDQILNVNQVSKEAVSCKKCDYALVKEARCGKCRKHFCHDCL